MPQPQAPHLDSCPWGMSQCLEANDEKHRNPDEEVVWPEEAQDVHLDVNVR